MTRPVGLLGLGLIGAAAAGRFRAAGLPVIGFDPDADRRDRFAAEGGQAAPDPAAVWRAADRVLIAVFDTAQVEAVVAAAPPGTDAVAAVASTCDPDRIAALGPVAASRGVRLVEASVSGTSRQLAEGGALIVTGGRAEDVAAADALFVALSARRRHAGPLGSANRTKLAINLVLGLNRAALAEGLVFAAGQGLDAAAFLEVLRASAARSDVMDVKGPMMVAGAFEPQGRVAQSAKDFGLILDKARERGGDLPFASLYAAMMADCVAHGESDLDNAAVIRAVRRFVERDATFRRSGEAR